MAAVDTDGSGCSRLAVDMGIAVVERVVAGLAVVDTDDPKCNMTLASELAVGNGTHVAAVDTGSPTCKVSLGLGLAVDRVVGIATADIDSPTCKVPPNSEMGGIDVDGPAAEGIA